MFLEIYSIHINVFHHYFNNVLEAIDTIKNNHEIKSTIKIAYYKRFSSNLSFFELVMLAYYTDAFITDNKIRIIITENFISRLRNLKFNDNVPYKEQVRFIMDQIEH